VEVDQAARSRALKIFAAVVATAIVLLLAWQTFALVLLVFAGILLAILLSGLAGWLCGHTPISRSWSLAVTVIALLAITGFGIWAMTPSLASQADQLSDQLPRAWKHVIASLQESQWGRVLIRRIGNPAQGVEQTVASVVAGLASTVLDVVAGAVMVFFVGLYLAASPELYRRGLIRLFPPGQRRRVAEVLDVTGNQLWRWLMGRIILMVSNGLLTTLGLALLGIPLAFVLGVIAGLLNFVPNIGPIIGAIPAVLIGLMQDPATGLYVALLYLVLQMVDGYVLTPLVDQRAVSTPPALIITFQVFMGLVVGALGLLVATPLAAVLLVLVKMLYIEDTLGEQIAIQGEEA
jgi:predicted PurR-regulated permease PerM